MKPSFRGPLPIARSGIVVFNPDMNPTRLFSALFCFALGSCALAPAARADDLETKIREIRARYEAIEKAKPASQTIAFEGETDPISGECTIHRQGGEIVKVVFKYGGDHGASEEYHYYTAGRLFFSYASDGAWSFTGRTLPNGESETVDSVTEHRVYYEGGTILRHLVKEAKSTDASKLPALLAKTNNQPGDSGERARRLLRMGQGLLAVQRPADLEALVIQSVE